jgi:hypothetical protein
MGIISDTFSNAWRDYVVPNIPGSGINDPDKAEIRNIGPAIESRINDVIAGQQAGAVVYDTLAHLNADLAHAAGTRGEVTSDPTSTNNGVYSKSGASGAGS